MSQPQLTKFFANAKRGTKINAKSAKLLLDPAETAPKRSSRRTAAETESVNKGEVTEPSAPEVLEATKANVPAVKKRVEKDVEANEITEKENQDEAGSCPSPVKKTRRSSRSRENSCSKDKVEEQETVEEQKKVKEKEQEQEIKAAKKPAVKKRNTARAKLAEVPEEPAPSSPSKRARTSRSSAVREATEAARELKARLTPGEVKAQLSSLKGRNKLALLQQQLKSIQENAKSAEQVRAEAAAKQEAEAAATKAETEKAARAATPAYQKFHNLAAKDSGQLPLPYTYKFLAEVFKCTEVVGAMLHNRQEVITVEKFKKGVQQMMRRNFQVEYLKQIKTVFPAAYRYAWEQAIGRYGKKLNEYELKVAMNMDFRKETLEQLEGDATDESKAISGKLTPTAMLERTNIFHNSLVQRVRIEHSAFCKSVGVEVNEACLQKFHKDFDVDSCPEIPITELPLKPELEKYQTAKEVLETARSLFEAAPRVAAVLEEVAARAEQGKEQKEVAKEVAKEAKELVPSAPVPKSLASVPLSLLERVRAKEREKKAREMYQDKGEEVRIKRLKRLPEIARIVKGVFVSEARNALKRPFVLQKLYQSYPGFTEKDVLALDLDKLAEMTAPWLTVRPVQGELWMKLDRQTDVNIVAANLEMKAKE